MPAYTHLQRAEPVLVAHWLLAYVEMFLRDLDRLADCRKRLNQCPLGSGAVAGTILPLDREALRKSLEFDAPTANSMDATSDRDFAIEFVQALSFVALHLSRWAEELILFATHGVRVRQAAGAVLDRQQRDAAEEESGCAGTDSRKGGKVFAEATALLHHGEGTAAGLQQGHAGDAAAGLRCGANRSASMLTGGDGIHVASVTFDYERMQEAASGGLHECAGCGCVSGAPGSAVPQGARADRQGRAVVRREGLRA